VPAGVVVYGTDTGVGKTVVTAALASLALADGVAVRVLKPVQTGAGDDDDGATIDNLVGRGVSRTGWRLKHPLAPVVAARLERRRLDPDRIVAWIARTGARARLVLVETAGGVAVEIAPGYDMARLGAALGFAGVVVSRPGLGTLNHTVLTVEHLRRARARVDGLVVSGMPSRPGIIETTNLEELPRLTGLPVLGVLPRLPLDSETGRERFGRRARAALGEGILTALV
jgi:dethiobiotin synthetase